MPSYGYSLMCELYDPNEHALVGTDLCTAQIRVSRPRPPGARMFPTGRHAATRRPRNSVDRAAVS